MNKLVSERTQAMSKILEGVNLVVNPVVASIGPNGKTTLVAKSYMQDYGIENYPVLCTKDGFNITKSISSPDPEVQVGVRLVQQAAEVQMEKMGDATSSVCLFTKEILTGGLNLIKSGVSSLKVISGINEAVGYVSEAMTKMATPINGDVERIRMIASVTANNDKFIGDLIADAFDKTGDDGVFQVEESKGRVTSVRVSDGVKFSRGWASPYFITNKAKSEAVLDKPFILLYDRPITILNDLMPLLERILNLQGQTGVKRPLVIFCEKTDGEALATLTFNTQQGSLQSCVVEMQALGQHKRDFMNDLAICTNGKFVSELDGIKLENVTIDMLGQADKVIVGKDETVVIGGMKDQELFDKLIEDLKALEALEQDTEANEMIKKRIARLKGAVAILSVAGITEIEMRERMDRIDDSIRSVRSSINGGWVVGGGTAFLRVPKKEGSEGWNLIMSVLAKPLTQICINSEKNPQEVIDLVLSEEGNIGYNAKTDNVEDLSVSGIIEPVQSNIYALQNAASVVCQILSSQYMIVDTL